MFVYPTREQHYKKLICLALMEMTKLDKRGMPMQHYRMRNLSQEIDNFQVKLWEVK